MAFPSSIGAKQDDLATAWGWVRIFAGTVKQESQQVRNASASGPIGADLLVQLVNNLANARTMLARATAVPGLQAYVRNQISDASIDIAAEFTTMVAQLDSVIAWIVTNFPKDAGGFLLYHSLDAQGNLVIRNLTSVQTGGLRTQLDLLIATID